MPEPKRSLHEVGVCLHCEGEFQRRLFEEYGDAFKHARSLSVKENLDIEDTVKNTRSSSLDFIFLRHVSVY